MCGNSFSGVERVRLVLKVSSGLQAWCVGGYCGVRVMHRLNLNQRRAVVIVPTSCTHTYTPKHAHTHICTHTYTFTYLMHTHIHT